MDGKLCYQVKSFASRSCNVRVRLECKVLEGANSKADMPLL